MKKHNTVPKIAKEYRELFTLKTREDGTRFWTSDTDEAVELAREAHNNGDILPDDYRYEYIVNALDLLCDLQEGEEPQNADASIEPDAYTADLTNWLGSMVHRIYYLEDAVNNGATDGFQILAMAQLEERREVFAEVLNFLERKLED